MHTSIISNSPEETASVGTQMADRRVADWNNKIQSPHVYCLYGDLGSGKTTFTQGFAAGLGINTRLLSPTFLISKRYTTSFDDRFLYHLDIYRMESEKSLQGIGISEIFSDIRSCVVVEWAEKLQSSLPSSRTDITFASNTNGSHTITIETYEY